MSNPDLHLDVGRRVASPTDAYEILHRRGSGGFAEVWDARRVSDGRRVILKELRLEKLKDWKALELFEREAKVLKGLKHSGIPEYVDFFARTAEGALEPGALKENPHARLCLIQELVEGQTLADRIGSGPPVDTSDARAWLEQALEILVYLHGLNPPVVHRDLHPKNIILSTDGSVHFVDFGAIQDKALFDDEFGSTSVGTFGYIPLEQSMGQARPASDLYALGMSFVSLVTGRRPGDLPLDEHTGSVNLDAARVPDALKPTLAGMIQPIVGKRFSSAGLALDTLRGLNQPLVPYRPAPAAVQPTPAWATWLFRAAFVGGLLGAVWIYLFNFNNFSETEMVQVSGLWFVPAVFGFSGFMYTGSPNPVAKAAVTAIVGAGGLFFFLVAIFPSL